MPRCPQVLVTIDPGRLGKHQLDRLSAGGLKELTTLVWFIARHVDTSAGVGYDSQVVHYAHGNSPACVHVVCVLSLGYTRFLQVFRADDDCFVLTACSCSSSCLHVC